jgi:hypothetical protein
MHRLDNNKTDTLKRNWVIIPDTQTEWAIGLIYRANYVMPHPDFIHRKIWKWHHNI